MGKFIQKLLYHKSSRSAILGYLFGILSIPLLQLAFTDIQSFVVIVVPPIIIILVILLGVQTIIQKTLIQYQDIQQRRQVYRDILNTNAQVVADAMAIIVKNNWHLGENGFLRGLQAEAVNWANLHLNGANLEDAELYQANLENTWLEHAVLNGADMAMANLQDIKMSYANLTAAKIMTSNLRGGNLHGTIAYKARLAHSNLANTVLMGTDLRGADLTRVNLQGARFIQFAKFDKDTILPTAKFVRDGAKRNKILNLRWHHGFDWTPYQTGEAYRGYSDEWKQQMGWVEPALLPTIDEDMQSYLA
jgi:uncharacterized protein YjbI with pentapeptide repeats